MVEDIKERHAKGQPILVGTVAVETSELLSAMLDQAGVPHAVLNAKNHAKEAEIIMNAGQRGAVTIATNMAGRGTDIKLGPGVRELGGLALSGPNAMSRVVSITSCAVVQDAKEILAYLNSISR